jgi:hypothetical protein
MLWLGSISDALAPSGTQAEPLGVASPCCLLRRRLRRSKLATSPKEGRCVKTGSGAGVRLACDFSVLARVCW